VKDRVRGVRCPFFSRSDIGIRNIFPQETRLVPVSPKEFPIYFYQHGREPRLFCMESMQWPIVVSYEGLNLAHDGDVVYGLKSAISLIMHPDCHIP